jgi:hypothetical protein
VLDALPQEHEAAAVKYAALERRVEALERKAYGFRCELITSAVSPP